MKEKKRIFMSWQRSTVDFFPSVFYVQRTHSESLKRKQILVKPQWTTHTHSAIRIDVCVCMLRILCPRKMAINLDYMDGLNVNKQLLIMNYNAASTYILRCLLCDSFLSKLILCSHDPCGFLTFAYTRTHTQDFGILCREEMRRKMEICHLIR